MWAFLRQLRCWLDHDAEGPLPDADLPATLRMHLDDSLVQRILRDAGMFPIYRCRRCSQLLQWRRTNGGWQTITPAELAVVMANARLLRMTHEINDHLRDRPTTRGDGWHVPPLR